MRRVAHQPAAGVVGFGPLGVQDESLTLVEEGEGFLPDLSVGAEERWLYGLG